MSKVKLVAEQLRIDGGVDYVVYYKDGTAYMFEHKPTGADLTDPKRRGRKI